ncbi:hypothetical protein, partial [Atlantibacter sp.]|uniref:hypothetical protein n=1 Tax=Atlantibacter sp. TaxID=1903473 RepID=UPI0028B020DF
KTLCPSFFTRTLLGIPQRASGGFAFRQHPLVYAESLSVIPCRFNIHVEPNKQAGAFSEVFGQKQ